MKKINRPAVIKAASAEKKQAKKATKKPIKKRLEKSADSLLLKLGKMVWPLERDVLFRPDRLKYVRKLIKSDGCVFCAAATSDPSFESLVLYKTKHCMVVMNKFPYNPGHILVLPQRHCGSILDLSEDEYFDLSKLKRLSFAKVEEAYQPGGMNLGLNHGAVAGAGIPEHLHYHIVPRWSGDMNFFPLIAETKAIPTDLQSSHIQLQKVFQI